MRCRAEPGERIEAMRQKRMPESEYRLLTLEEREERRKNQKRRWYDANKDQFNAERRRKYHEAKETEPKKGCSNGKR